MARIDCDGQSIRGRDPEESAGNKGAPCYALVGRLRRDREGGGRRPVSPAVSALRTSAESHPRRPEASPGAGGGKDVDSHDGAAVYATF